MKRLMITAVFLIVSLQAFSQTTIKGSIKDAVTNEKIQNVSIYIVEINKVVTSNYFGDFILYDLPVGIVKLRFSRLGYKTYNITLKTEDFSDSIEVKMFPLEISTEEILVSDTAIIKSYQTDKITAKEYMRMGSMNISEAVSIIPGVWQLSTGTGISKPVIRGLYGNRIGIMVNGIRFDNQQWQDEHGLVMSSDGIDNIEVIKGPRTLLFGPEAIGGVVSITDELPAPIGMEIADMNLKFFTNTLGILGNIGFKGAQENFNWLVRFGGETHADYLDGNEDRIPQTRFGGYTIKTAGGYMKGIWAGRLNYSYTNYTYGILEGREFEREIASNETRFDRSFNGPHHILNVHNVVSQNIFIKDRSKFTVNLGYIYNRRQEEEGNDERFLPDSLQFGDLDMTLNTLSLDAGWRYRLNNKTDLTFGTQEFFQSNVNNGDRRLIPDANVNSISLSGLVNYSNYRFSLEGGARYDLFSVKTTEYGVKDSLGYFPPISPVYSSVNGSLGMTYFLSNEFLLKANFSTGFRTPNLAELTSNGLHEGVFQYEIGNPDFKSEQSIEFDADLKYTGRYFTLEVSGYNNNINNYIYLGQTSDTLKGYPVFRYFQSDASLNGFETELTITPTNRINFTTAYSTVIAKRDDGIYLPLIPADKFTSTVNFELDNWGIFENPYFEVTAYSVLEKTRLGENEAGVPGYTLFNTGFGCDLNFEKQLINITVNFNNMFNNVYIDFMSRIKLLNANYNGKTFYANNIGRNIVLAIKIPFKLSYN